MPSLAALVDKTPGWFRRFAYRTAKGHGSAGRLVDRVRFRFSSDKPPRLPDVPTTRTRLVIAPANFATQGYLWARTVERFFPDATATSASYGQNAFDLDVDVAIPATVYSRSAAWHSLFEAFVSRHTHAIWEAGRPLFGRRYEGGVAAEIERLAAKGVECALLFHGSDVRLPSAHAANHRWTPFLDQTEVIANLEQAAARNLELAATAGVPVFVSTPDMLQWIPEATWCPVVVDSARWRAAAAEALSREPGRPPVVVHAPSRPWLKGTDRIEPMLRDLEAQGVIEYRQVVGVPHASMPAFYADADIMLDQFVLGIYGVAACEAMASGRLVMSHVDEFTRRLVHERTGLELPIYESTLDTLEEDLRRAAAEPEAFERFRREGPSFVDTIHDGRWAAQALAPFLGREAPVDAV